MATKTFNTKIALRYDLYENWLSNDPVLLAGELALAAVSTKQGDNVQHVPSVLIKCGDGEHKYSELDYVFAKAADVLSACKTEEGLTAFINGVIAKAGIATDEAMQQLAGRVGTAEGKITTLEGKMTAVEGKASANESAISALNGLVGDTAVSAQISKAISDLNLATTYEAKGEAAKVQTALETYKTSNDAAVKKVSDDLASEIARAGVAEKANSDAIAAIKDGTTIDSFKDVEDALAGKEVAGAAAQALIDAKSYADGLAVNYDAKGAAATAESNAKAYAKEYADGLAGNYDASGSAAQALVDAKAYTDGEIAEWIGDKTVAQQIADLKLGETYDAKGAAAAAEAAAKSHANGLNTAMDERMQVVEGKAHEHANKEELDKIVVGDKAKWDAMEQSAKDYADGLNTAMDGRVADLEAMFGDGEGTVEAQIEAAVSAEAGLREAADTALGNRVTAIENDYLKAADKTELQGKIDTLNGLVGDETVAKQIGDAVKEEADRAKGIEGGLETRLAAVEADYLTSAEEKALQDQITANASAIELLTNGVKADEVDGVNDLIKYVKEHGTEVTGMKGDIKANADAIDAIEADYLKAADKNELSGLIGGLDTRMGAAETAIGTKAAQSDLETLAGRVTTVEGKVTTLEGEMDDAQSAISALNGLVGDETVSKQVGDAINELKNGQLNTMQGEIDAVEGRVDTLEGKAHEHANKTVLDGISSEKVAAWDAKVDTVTAAAGSGLKATRTGNDIAIELDESIVFIFNCGDSSDI